MTLGQSLINVRERLNLTQKDAAKKIGISVHHLCEIECDKAKPSMKVLENISKTYEIPVPILLWPMLKEEDIMPHLVEIYRELKPEWDKQIYEFYFANK